MTDPQLSASPLPRARQLAVTWGIPDPYGGMTAALLSRCRLFARAGARVDIVTFETRPDYDAVRTRLQERGALPVGVALRNIYEDVRTTPRPPKAVPLTPTAAAGRPDEIIATAAGSVEFWRTSDGVVRAEHRRADGTLAVLEERRDVGGRNRVVTAFDARGRTTGQWTSMRRFRFAWLDAVIAGEPAVAVVDSKLAARTLQHYRRAQVTLIHHVHGAHRDATGALTAARREIFENLGRWDAVGFLTERQRAEAIAQLGDTGNLHVVHNAVNIPDWMPRLPPDRLHGVIAARLSRRKRVDHALEVIAGVRRLGVPVTVDILGDGPERERLEARAAWLGLGRAVHFAGHTPDAAARFAQAAWTLLTSRSEGEPLALLEAMGAGCLPVAYDIPYGPADVLRHDRSGFLVPEGDVVAATAALIRLCSLADDSVATMRRQARRVALEYSDGDVLAQWADVQGAAIRRHAERRRRARPSLLRRTVRRAVRVSRGAALALRGWTPHPR
jgi:poly(glycerol-phosphate) alpha-glucosyltransferase